MSSKIEIRRLDLVILLALAFLFGFATRGLLGQPSPASETRAAAVDAEKCRRPATTQWLTMLSIPPEQRDEHFAVVSLVLQTLSRSRAIVPPTRVSDTLIRFDLRDYVDDEQAYADWQSVREDLAKIDPDFHLTTQIAKEVKPAVVAVPAKTIIGPTGQPQTIAAVEAVAAITKVETVTVDGGWTDLAAMASLKKLARSNAPILRSDFFVFFATRAPAYHTLAGIGKTEKEFLKSLGLDADAIAKLRAEYGVNLAESNVANFQRRISQATSPFGSVYGTFDTNKADAEHDFLRRPISVNGLQTKFEAREFFAVSPNGMWRVAIFDANGKRLDAVDSEIATSDFGDRVIRNGQSCLICHGTEGGLRSWSDDQTRLKISSYDPQVIESIRSFYQPKRVERQMSVDRENHAEAVKAATGMEPKEAYAALGRAIYDYAFAPVTSERAAREVGLSPEEFKQAMGPATDPIMLLLGQGRSVKRGSYSANFQEPALLAMNYQLAKEKGPKQ